MMIGDAVVLSADILNYINLIIALVVAHGWTERTVNSMADKELFGISEQLDDTISRQAAIDANTRAVERSSE